MDLQHAHLGKADEPLLVIDEKILPPGLLLRDHDGLQVLGDSRARMLLEEAFLATTLRTAEKAEWAFRDVRQDPLRDLLVEEGQIALREALLWIEHALRVCQSHPGNVFAPRFSRDRRHSGRGSRNRNPLDITLERHGAITGRGREAERRPPAPPSPVLIAVRPHRRRRTSCRSAPARPPPSPSCSRSAPGGDRRASRTFLRPP